MMKTTTISVLLLLANSLVYTDSLSCQLCIIDYVCGDDSIHFNVSVSSACKFPMNTYFSYGTDIAAGKHYLNLTIGCADCYVDLSIDTIRDAWDYTLRLESPELEKTCATTLVAHCGGEASRLVWVSATALSGLFVVLGVILCTVRHCRTRQQMRIKERKIEEAVINWWHSYW